MNTDLQPVLLKKNYWTKSFTNEAILEYKKFMYLAATSNAMVSPSEIVDVVWHQHLIFTKSYQKFCELIEKQIQHIPSTHNKEDFEKFKQAKEQTKILYENEFGVQPKNIWEFSTMFESLKLEKAKYKLRTFINFGIFIFVCLIVPFYFILEPIYLKIEGGTFIFLLLILAILIFLILEIYNKNKFNQLISDIDKSSYIFNLKPNELIYLKKQNLVDVINITIDKLIKENTVKISDTKQLLLLNNEKQKTNEAYQVVTLFPKNNIISYIELMSRLKYKPIFSNIENCLDATTKYIIKSKTFSSIFYINFLFYSILILLAFTRIITGLVHSKNVLIIIAFTVILIIFTIFHLNRLTTSFTTKTLPKYYTNQIIPKQTAETKSDWNYFLLGTTALLWSFQSIAEDFNSEKNQTTSCSSCGTSCGSCGGCSGCGS